jgi:hypothetical protein
MPVDALDILDAAFEEPDAVGMSEADPVPEVELEPFEAGPDAEIDTSLLRIAVDPGPLDIDKIKKPLPKKANGPDPIEERRYATVQRAVSEITESKVNIYLGKLTQPRQLGNKDSWLTDRKHLIAGDAFRLVKTPSFLKDHWSWVKFLRGSDLGTGDGEVSILMGMAIYQCLFAEFEKNLK